MNEPIYVVKTESHLDETDRQQMRTLVRQELGLGEDAKVVVLTAGASLDVIHPPAHAWTIT